MAASEKKMHQSSAGQPIDYSHQEFETPQSIPFPDLTDFWAESHISGKERDAETGLDFFLARYYSGAQGRFLSVDPDNAGASVDDPQSWNAYSYALNNPLRYVDPDGLAPGDCYVDGVPVHCGVAKTWLRNDAGRITNAQRIAWDDDNKAFRILRLDANSYYRYMHISEDEFVTYEGNGPNVTVTVTSTTRITPQLANAGAFTLIGILLADDASGVGVLDDWLIPIVLGGAAIGMSGETRSGNDINVYYKEHKSNARPSTENAHQKGKASKKQARGGEKGDEKRRPPRKRPDGWTGPWPPPPGTRWW